MCQAPEPRLLQAKKEASAVETGVGGQGDQGPLWRGDTQGKS